MTQLHILQKKIMRRVYYAYVMRIATHPFVTHGMVLALCAYALVHFISVPSIIANMKTVPLGSLDNFILNALMRAEVWVLLLIGVIFFTVISLRFNLRGVHVHNTQTV